MLIMKQKTVYIDNSFWNKSYTHQGNVWIYFKM